VYDRYEEEYHTSIHLQNTQLYAFGVVANGAVVLARDMEGLAAGAALEGFDAQAGVCLITCFHSLVQSRASSPISRPVTCFHPTLRPITCFHVNQSDTRA
jgi:hypothetical protein